MEREFNQVKDAFAIPYREFMSRINYLLDLQKNPEFWFTPQGEDLIHGRRQFDVMMFRNKLGL